MTTVMEPLTPTDEELAGMTKPQLTAVIESYGVRPSSKTDKPGLLKTAKAFVHERSHDLDATRADAAEPVATSPGPDAPPIVADEPAVELEPAALHVVPEYSRFQVIQQVAAVLAQSELTPDALRRKVPEVTHILLKANDIGVPLTTALDQIYVIRGKTGMEAKLMRTLIRRDGHLLRQPDYDGFRATVWGRRCDTGEEAVGEFTLKDAADFDLIAGWSGPDDNGDYTVKPLNVNGSNPKPQWVKDTKNMLIERATSRLARWLFSECLGGVTYTPDELGWGMEVEVGDELGGGGPKPSYGRAGEPEPTMTIGAQRKELAGRLSELPDDLQQSIKADWVKRNFPKVTDLSAAAVRVARGWVEAAEATVRERESTDDIPEADVVEDRQEAGEPGPAPAGAGDDGTAAATVAASPAPDVEPDMTTMICAGCFEPIVLASGETLVARSTFVDGQAVEELNYHADCAPDEDEPGDELGLGYQ